MNRLFKLKKWLTVPEAARHLSIVFGEEVNESDVLRLALDGHLKLSVNFVNHARARSGKVVRYSESELVTAIVSGNLPKDLKWHTWPPGAMAALRPDLSPEEAEKSATMLMSLRIDDERYLTLGDKVTTLWDVWDLPFIGDERLDVEHKYQQLTDGPAVTLQGLDGAFVQDQDGHICQLHESDDDNEYQRGSEAHLRKLEERIVLENIEPSKAKELLDQHKKERKKFLTKWNAKKDAGKDSENYYPAGGLPSDSVLVVRTEALREFEESIIDAPSRAEKPLTTTERNTLLTIIAALCDFSAIKPQERGAAAQIAKLTEEIGATVTDDTVRTALARIPDALAARMK